MKQAMMNPATSFGTPEAVLCDPILGEKEKEEILRQWRYDQYELAVALEEGMQGPEPEWLSRIQLALDKLHTDNEA